jgi:hypothetical protein
MSSFHWKDKLNQEYGWERYESLWKYEDIIQVFEKGHYKSQVVWKFPG